MKNELHKRLFEFILRVFKFLKTLPDTKEFSVIRYQLLKSSSSTGANYEEAQAVSSRADFVHKVEISIKKTLKVDYFRGRAREYRPAGYANFISAKKPKIEFSLFHPTVRSSTDFSPEIQVRIYGTPRQSLEELFD